MTMIRYRTRYRLSRRRKAARLWIVGVVAILTLARVGTDHGHFIPVSAPHVPTSSAERAWIRAFLADLGVPRRNRTAADGNSLAAWITHETSWPPVAANNPMNTTLWEPGATAHNTLPGGGHVWNYPTVGEGLAANAITLEHGYPGIVAAFRSGNGICGQGLAGEFGTWSGPGGYTSVC